MSPDYGLMPTTSTLSTWVAMTCPRKPYLLLFLWRKTFKRYLTLLHTNCTHNSSMKQQQQLHNQQQAKRHSNNNRLAGARHEKQAMAVVVVIGGRGVHGDDSSGVQTCRIVDSLQAGLALFFFVLLSLLGGSPHKLQLCSLQPRHPLQNVQGTQRCIRDTVTLCM